LFFRTYFEETGQTMWGPHEGVLGGTDRNSHDSKGRSVKKRERPLERVKVPRGCGCGKIYKSARPFSGGAKGVGVGRGGKYSD